MATPRSCRRALAAMRVAWLVGACLLGAGGPGAEESRFIAWKGGPTPGLQLRDLSGRSHTLDDYRGQVVLLNFWATWCEFCKEEITSMRQLQHELRGRPLAILSINFGESAAKVRAYAPNLTANTRVLLDGDQDTAKLWRVRVIPTSFLVDAEGRVRYSVIGNLDWASAESVRTVRALLP